MIEIQHKLLRLSFVVVLLSLTIPVYAASSDSAKIDKRIPETLKTEKYVGVIILLQDDSGISYSANKEKSDEIYRMKSTYFNRRQDEIITFLGPQDFVVKYKFASINALSGYITKEGLEKMNDISSVRKISSTYIKAGEHVTESAPLIGANNVWDIKVDGVNVTGNETICIIDSGINSSISAFYGRIVKEQCYCDCGLFCGCCPNGEDEDDNATDDRGHGTMVSVAVAGDDEMYKGVAPDAKIIAVKVLDSKGDLKNLDDLTKAIDFCTNMSANVITMSLGTDDLYPETCDAYYPYWSEEVNAAINKDIFVVASSGNDADVTQMSSPACIENVSSVGMTYDESRDDIVSWDGGACNDTEPPVDYISCKGNRNIHLDLVAPGIVICSINLTGNSACDGGTSYSAPHVAGVASLLIQYEKLKNGRLLTAKEINDRLKDTGKLLFDSGNHSTTAGSNLTFPRIDAYSALFPIDVYDFKRVSASDTYNVFFFKVKNNYNNKTKAVNWTFDIGNGTMDTSEEDTSLSPGEDLWVFFEENYTDGDIYNVRATAASGTDSDTEEMTLTLGDIIAHDMKLVYSNGVQKVFFFKILNNMDTPQLVNWTLYTGDDDEQDSADTLTLLQPNEDMWVYFENNYTSPDTYNVRAKAFNVNSTDYTETVTVNVGESGSSGIGNYTMTTLGYGWTECSTDFWSPGDDAVKNFRLPFDFRFYNVTYGGNVSDIAIDSNGRIAFTGISSDYTPTDAEMFSEKTVAVNWKDLYPRSPMQICNYTDANGGYTVVEYHSNWYSVPQQNSEVIFYQNGTIRINYGLMENATTAGSTGKGNVWLGVSNDDGGTYFTRTVWHNVNENRSYTSYNFVPS